MLAIPDPNPVLALSALAQGVQGNDVYFLYGNFAYETQARGFNSYREILRRWTPSNPDTDIPKVSVDDRNGNRRISTRFLEDGSYLRIQNITLGYRLPGTVINRAQMSNLRLFVTVQNLYTFTNYTGYDPEVGSYNNSIRLMNVDAGHYPNPRTYMGGVSVEF